MRPGLGVDDDGVRAGFRESLQIGVAGRDHQMDVEDPIRRAAQGLHDIRPDGDIGHEMPVHHIDMDDIRPGSDNGADFFAEFGKIGGEDRRSDFQRAHLFIPELWRFPAGLDRDPLLQDRRPVVHRPRAAVSFLSPFILAPLLLDQYEVRRSRLPIGGAKRRG